MQISAYQDNTKDLTVGTTYNITCSVPGLDDSSAIMWTSSAAAVPVSTTNTLTLQSVNNTLNGTEFTCSVSSSKLYSSGMKIVTVTILGMFLIYRYTYLVFTKYL